VSADWPDPAFLAKLAAGATRIQIAAGQKQSIALRTARLP